MAAAALLAQGIETPAVGADVAPGHDLVDTGLRRSDAGLLIAVALLGLAQYGVDFGRARALRAWRPLGKRLR